MAGIISNGTFTLGANIGEVTCADGVTGTGTPDSPVRMDVAGFTPEQVQALKQVLGVDETVLFEGSVHALNTKFSLSESYKNFERIKIYAQGVDYRTNNKEIHEFDTVADLFFFNTTVVYTNSHPSFVYVHVANTSTLYDELAIKYSCRMNYNPGTNSWYYNGTGTDQCYITKIVGIGRKA